MKAWVFLFLASCFAREDQPKNPILIGAANALKVGIQIHDKVKWAQKLLKRSDQGEMGCQTLSCSQDNMTEPSFNVSEKFESVFGRAVGKGVRNSLNSIGLKDDRIEEVSVQVGGNVLLNSGYLVATKYHPTQTNQLVVLQTRLEVLPQIGILVANFIYFPPSSRSRALVAIEDEEPQIDPDVVDAVASAVEDLPQLANDPFQWLLNRGIREIQRLIDRYGFTWVLQSVLFAGHHIPAFKLLQDRHEVGILQVDTLTNPGIEYVDNSTAIRPVFVGHAINNEYPNILPGKMMYGAVSFKKCEQNAICKLIQRSETGALLLKYQEFSTSPIEVTRRASAGLANIVLTNSLLLESSTYFVDLKVDLKSPSISTGIESSLAVRLDAQTEPLAFRGTVKQNLIHTRVSLDFAMIGVWQKAFQVPFLHFGNLQFGAGYNLETNLVSRARIGGQLGLGYYNGTNWNSLISAQAYMSVDLEFLPDSYVYAYLSACSVQEILDVFFRNKFQLPDVIGKTGILAPRDDMPGALFSYSMANKFVIPDTQPAQVIPTGLTIAARFVVFGKNATIDLSFIPITLQLKALIQLPPLSTSNGLFQIQKSRNDSTHGPELKLNTKLSKSDPPGFLMDGYMNILGWETAVHVEATSKGFSIYRESILLFGFLESKTWIDVSVQDRRIRAKGVIKSSNVFRKILQNIHRSIRRLWFKIKQRTTRRLSWLRNPPQLVIRQVSYDVDVGNVAKNAFEMTFDLELKVQNQTTRLRKTVSVNFVHFGINIERGVFAKVREILGQKYLKLNSTS